jgi:hypothetical protein
MKVSILKISVLVSILCHPINITRYAMNGLIKFSKYHPGKFLVAWHPKASEENERTTVVVKIKLLVLFCIVKLRWCFSQENSKLCRRRNASSTRYRCRIHQI